jgi:hypothetical protein
MESGEGWRRAGDGLLIDFRSWGQLINLCSLQYGQTKDAVFRVSYPSKFEDAGEPSVTVTLKYQTAIDPKVRNKEVNNSFHIYICYRSIRLRLNARSGERTLVV